MSDTTADNMQSLTSLTVLNATAALERGLAAIKAGQDTFDLRHVLTVDSVAVSVMLSWQRAAHDAGRELTLKNLPPALQSLTRLYGVCSLLFPASAQQDSSPGTAEVTEQVEFVAVAHHPVDASGSAKLRLGNAPADPHHHH